MQLPCRPFRLLTTRRRPVIPPRETAASGTPDEGIVIRATAGACRVDFAGRVWLCRVRGRLKQGRQEARTIAVAGDRVRLLTMDAEADPPTAVIEEVLPRRNRVSRLTTRRAGGHLEQVLMANLDQVVAVQSLRDPRPQAGFVDRLLVSAERFGVAGVLVLNKCELDDVAAERARGDYFRSLGYTVLETSAVTGAGLEALAATLRNRISLLLGASGVGKSSLLNVLEPGLGLRVNAVTTRTGLGRHTTTRTELFPLADGGYIADSPGMRGFDPWDIDPVAAREYFPDFVAVGDGCRFRTCLHREEPDCAVKTAVAAGAIPGWRHEAYLKLVRDLEDRQNRAGPRPRR